MKFQRTKTFKILTFGHFWKSRFYYIKNPGGFWPYREQWALGCRSRNLFSRSIRASRLSETSWSPFRHRHGPPRLDEALRPSDRSRHEIVRKMFRFKVKRNVFSEGGWIAKRFIQVNRNRGFNPQLYRTQIMQKLSK